MGMKQIASRLIARHGQAATLLRRGDVTYGPFGDLIYGPDTDYPVTVLSATYMVELQFVGAGFVDMTDRRVFVSAYGLTITPGHSRPAAHRRRGAAHHSRHPAVTRRRGVLLRTAGAR